MKSKILLFVNSLALIWLALTPYQAQAKTPEKIQSINSIAAVVNSSIITQSELDHQFNIIKKQIQLQHQPMPSDTVLKKKILKQLIDQKLILQIAKQNNMSVSDSELNQAIKSIASRNHLSVAELKQQIVKQGVDYEAYRKQIRTQLLMNLTERRAVGGDIQVTDAEVKKALQTMPKPQNVPLYHLQAMLVPVPNAPSPEELQKAQAKADSIISELHKGNDFSTIALTETFQNQPLSGGDMGWKQLSQLPPVIAGELAGSMKGSIIGPVQTPNGYYIIKVVGIKTFNASHKVTLTHLKTIIIKQGELKTGQAVEAELNNIRAKIVKGASFAAMAKKYSQDKPSAAKGGDLGWVTPNEIPTTLAQAMAKLKQGEVSEPVKTPDGWQIIEVTGRKSVNNTTASLKTKVKQMLYMQKFEQAVKNWVAKLRSQAYIKVIS